MKQFKRNGKSLRKTIITLALGGVLLLGLTACGNANASNQKSATGHASENSTTIRLGVMTGNTDQWTAAVAEEKGFFKKQGLKVEVTEFAAGINTVDAIVTGQSDIGFLADYAAVNRLGNTQDATNLRIFARYQHSKGIQTKLYVNTKKVKKLSDLAGQGVITLPGTVWDYWNGKTFEKARIPKDKQVLVNVDNTQAALSVFQSGDGVAFWAGGNNGKKLQEAGYEPLVSAADLDLPSEQYYFATDEYLKKNEDTVKKFLTAIHDTQEWVIGHKEEAAKIANVKTNVPEEQFLSDLEALELNLSLKKESIEHLNEVKEWALKEGKFKKDFTFEDFIDAAPLKALYPENVEY